MRRATSAMSNPGKEKPASTISRIPRARPVVTTNVRTKDGNTFRNKVRDGKPESPAKPTSAPSTTDVGASSPRSPSSVARRAPKHHLQPRRDRKGPGSKENLPQGTPSCKPPPKSAMSYMELKKCHQSLLAEKESLERNSKEKEAQQQAAIHQLAEEIKLFKEQNTALKNEISSCQEKISERSQQLNVLQQHLEEIKLENERMAAILGRARVDPVTCEQMELAIQQQAEEEMIQVELETHERRVDRFLSTLEATIGDLQKQKECLLGKNHVVI